MKTKNLLSRFTAAALVAAAALLPTALTSCSSEADQPTPDPDPIPEGMGRINLSFTTPGMGTLTRTAPDDGELVEDNNSAKVDDLYLYIFQYKADGSGTLVDGKVIDITPAENAGLNVETGDYKQVYQQDIAAGKYRFYIVGNISQAGTVVNNIKPSGSNLSSLTEATFLATSINFSSQIGIAGLKEGLPMIAEPLDFSIPSGSNAVKGTDSGNSYIEIKDGANGLHADLVYLCSALRYTVLFDNNDGEYSQMHNNFNITSITLKNLNYTQKLAAGNAPAEAVDNSLNLMSGSGNLEGKKYDISGIENFTTDGFINSPYRFDNTYLAATNADWETRPSTAVRRAFQGVIAIPENCGKTDALQTKMDITVKLDGVSKTFSNLYIPKRYAETADHSSHSDGQCYLKRGHFYDVIIRFTGTGIDFQVKVKAWSDKGREVFPF